MTKGKDKRKTQKQKKCPNTSHLRLSDVILFKMVLLMLNFIPAKAHASFSSVSCRPSCFIYISGFVLVPVSLKASGSLSVKDEFLSVKVAKKTYVVCRLQVFMIYMYTFVRELFARFKFLPYICVVQLS